MSIASQAALLSLSATSRKESELQIFYFVCIYDFCENYVVFDRPVICVNLTLLPCLVNMWLFVPLSLSFWSCLFVGILKLGHPNLFWKIQNHSSDCLALSCSMAAFVNLCFSVVLLMFTLDALLLAAHIGPHRLFLILAEHTACMFICLSEVNCWYHTVEIFASLDNSTWCPETCVITHVRVYTPTKSPACTNIIINHIITYAKKVITTATVVTVTIWSYNYVLSYFVLNEKFNMPQIHKS